MKTSGTLLLGSNAVKEFGALRKSIRHAITTDPQLIDSACQFPATVTVHSKNRSLSRYSVTSLS